MTKELSYNGILHSEMREFLEEKHSRFNNSSFISNDPVSIPHRYTDRRDIEISGFLTATIAWGRRDLIISSAARLMEMMGNNPYEFLMEADEKYLERFNRFYYRTFNGADCTYFLASLRNIYTNYSSLEDILTETISNGSSLKDAMIHFRNRFFSLDGIKPRCKPWTQNSDASVRELTTSFSSAESGNAGEGGLDHNKRTLKHFANVGAGSAGKRLNMFLRWMVRNDNRGVDFGLWNKIDPSELFIPLDIHSGNSARSLGLLKRKTNDWKAVEEVTSILKTFDSSDPVKYDFALFGIGVNEKFR